MLRSTFFAAGTFVLLCGIALFYVDEIHYKRNPTAEDESGFRGFFSRVTTLNEANKRVFEPPDWAAFSLMSIGSVTMLYAVALPKKHSHGHS